MDPNSEKPRLRSGWLGSGFLRLQVCHAPPFWLHRKLTAPATLLAAEK